MTGTRPLRLLRRLVPSLITLALVASGCTESGTDSNPHSSETGDQGGPVRELTSIDTLRDAFNQDTGSARLILLISPT